jgi:SPP1 gp7 family putative phage head morphogenesis protein
MADEIRKGTDLPQFRKAIEDSVGTGTFLSDAHLETTFRTNVMRGYSEGLQRVLDHPLIESGFPYLQYAAVHDDRVRNEHLEMEQYGIDGSDVYRRDDPVIRTFMPPWAFNCRCSVIPLSVNDAAYRGIREAEKWLESGQPPSRPAWVRYPPFSPPAGWTPTGYYPKAPIAMSLDRRLANGCVLDVHYETVASELAIPQAWKQRIDVVDGEIKKAWVHADGSITYVEPPLQFAQGSGGATWTQYKGPQGGMGWRSSKTGRIAYQTEMPGEDEHGGESQAEPTGQQKPPQDTGKPPVNAQGETVIEAEGGTIRVPEGGEVKETQDEVIEAPGGTITVPGAGAEIEQVQPNLQRLLAKKEVGLI